MFRQPAAADCWVVNESALPRAAAMLSGATALTDEGSWPIEARFRTVSVPASGGVGVPER